MTITLTPELEDVIAEEARRYGTTPEILAMETLQDRFAERLLAATGDTPLEEGMTLDAALSDLLAEAQSLERVTPPGMAGPFAEALAEKHRRRGLEI